MYYYVKIDGNKTLLDAIVDKAQRLKYRITNIDEALSGYVTVDHSEKRYLMII